MKKLRLREAVIWSGTPGSKRCGQDSLVRHSNCKAQVVHHHNLSSEDHVLLVSASPAPHVGPGTLYKQSILNELNQDRLLLNHSAPSKDLSKKVLGSLYLLILQPEMKGLISASIHHLQFNCQKSEGGGRLENFKEDLPTCFGVWEA